ncbi:Cohesin subunit SA-1 [Hordeum vulgare]|nr:Cohesin subunit SA-1 [Hordeum vulgare]
MTPIQSLAMDNDVPEEPPRGKRSNYDHYYEVGRPTHLCKVIMPTLLEAIPMPLDFTKNFPSVSHELKLKANIGCSWRVTVWMLNGRAPLDQGWATFTTIDRIKVGFMVTFKLLTPDTPKVIVFNDDGLKW